MKRGALIFWIAILIIVVLALGASMLVKTGPGNLDEFAQCLDEQGAQFYGAFWCPHCQAQKRLFGRSAELLPYVECSTPDGNNQLQVCIDAGVEQYPTWEFADGSRLTGERSLEELAAKTNCPLPDDESASDEGEIEEGGTSDATS